jgi:hypothetical protein
VAEHVGNFLTDDTHIFRREQSLCAQLMKEKTNSVTYEIDVCRLFTHCAITRQFRWCNYAADPFSDVNTGAKLTQNLYDPLVVLVPFRMTH